MSRRHYTSEQVIGILREAGFLRIELNWNGASGDRHNDFASVRLPVTTGNPHLNSKSKTIDSQVQIKHLLRGDVLLTTETYT
jgi:hypothetical protein